MAMDWSFFGNTGQDGNFQMNPQLLQMMAQTGAGLGKGQSVGQALGESTAQALRMKALMGQNPQAMVTPKGQEGPDTIKENVVHTADGVKRTITVEEPSKRNLETYCTNVPPESMKAPAAQGGVSDQSPFWKALLGQIS